MTPLRNRLVDQRLVSGDQILGCTGNVVDTELLRELWTDVACAGLVDGVEAKLKHYLSTAVDEVGKGEIERVQRLGGCPQNQRVCGALHGGRSDIEDTANEIGEFRHLFRSGAGDVDRLLDLALEPLTVLGRVFRNDDTGRVERYGKVLSDAKQKGYGVRVVGVLEIESQLLGGSGIVKDRANPVGSKDLSQHAA